MGKSKTSTKAKKSAAKKPAGKKPAVKKAAAKKVAPAKAAGVPDPGNKQIASVSAKAILARQARIFELLDKLDAEMSDSVELTEKARGKTSRVRGPEEKVALAAVLDFADAYPAFFGTLAERDGGDDASAFETAVLRDRLEVATALGAIADRFDASRRRVTDSALYVTSLVKPIVLEAYDIAKPIAKRDPKAGSKLRPAVDFFTKIAQAAAKKRQENKLARAAKAAEAQNGAAK